MNQAAEIIYDLVDPSANLIFGAVVDPSLSQEVRVQHSIAWWCWLLAGGPSCEVCGAVSILVCLCGNKCGKPL